MMLCASIGMLAPSCGIDPREAGSRPDGGPSDESDARLPPNDVTVPFPPEPDVDASSDARGATDAGDASVHAATPPPYLGGNVGDGEVVFRVWAPHATAVSVQGDFAQTSVAMAPVADGVFEAHVAGAHAGNTYTYLLTTAEGALTRVDPYCRELAGSACRVVDPNAFQWTSAFTRPARNAAVIYEMHIGSFTSANGGHGTFASTRDALPGLADLGVNVIELMPVQDFGGSAIGWGYNPQLYFAPMPDLGTSDDFRALVDRAHALGIAVWIDTVVNHTDGWIHAPLRCFDSPCDGGSNGIYFFPAGTYATTPWGPRPDYTAPNVATMIVTTIDSWMRELGADGFRFDSVSNIRAIDGQGTVPGGKDLLTSANARVHALGGLSVAEDLKGYGAITASTTAGGFAFDAQWDGFGYTLTNVLTQPTDAARDLAQVASALQGTSNGDPFARVLFTEDHDTVGNGGARLPVKIDGANPMSVAARKRAMLGAALLLTSPGVPMLFMGQENAEIQGFASPPSTLPAPSPEGLHVRAFYTDMIRLRRNLDGDSGGLVETGVDIVSRNDAAKVIAYRRHGSTAQGEVLVLANFGSKRYATYDVGTADAKPWRVRVDSDLAKYGSDFTGAAQGTLTPKAGAKDGLGYTLSIALGSYSVVVLTR